MRAGRGWALAENQGANFHSNFDSENKAVLGFHNEGPLQKFADFFRS
jgi:hypothetical protein